MPTWCNVEEEQLVLQVKSRSIGFLPQRPPDDAGKPLGVMTSLLTPAETADMTFFSAMNGRIYSADLVAEIVMPDGFSDHDVLKR